MKEVISYADDFECEREFVEDLGFLGRDVFVNYPSRNEAFANHHAGRGDASQVKNWVESRYFLGFSLESPISQIAYFQIVLQTITLDRLRNPFQSKTL